jgi:hypothetical protein
MTPCVSGVATSRQRPLEDGTCFLRSAARGRPRMLGGCPEVRRSLRRSSRPVRSGRYEDRQRVSVRRVRVRPHRRAAAYQALLELFPNLDSPTVVTINDASAEIALAALGWRPETSFARRPGRALVLKPGGSARCAWSPGRSADRPASWRSWSVPRDDGLGFGWHTGAGL